MAETLSYKCSSDTPAARSVREACPGTLDPLRQEWRRQVLRLGAGLFPYHHAWICCSSFFFNFTFLTTSLLFLPGWVIKSTAKSTCCGHSITSTKCNTHHPPLGIRESHEVNVPPKTTSSSSGGSATKIKTFFISFQ